MAAQITLAAVHTDPAARAGDVIAMLALAQIYAPGEVYLLAGERAVPIGVAFEIPKLGGLGLDQHLRERTYLMPERVARDRVAEQPDRLWYGGHLTATLYRPAPDAPATAQT